MEFGTPAQKARFLPAMASGDEIWAQAWSEPQAGSDLAGVRATAVADGDDYVLRGHKIWSSRAAFADWAFGLFRTPGSERHPRPIADLLSADLTRRHGEPDTQNQRPCRLRREIFLDDVRVPALQPAGRRRPGLAHLHGHRGLRTRPDA